MKYILNNCPEILFGIMGFLLTGGIIFGTGFIIYEGLMGIQRETTGQVFARTCESVGGKSVWDGRQYTCIK